MTATEVFTNQPTTTVATGGTTAPASGTVESWTVTSSSSFPAAVTGTAQFHVADTATGKTGEIIAVTNVSGTTWTVTRGAESSTTVAHTAGFTIVQVVTAGWLSTVSTSSGVQVLTFTYGSSGAVPSSGTYTAGTVAVDQNEIVRVCTVAGSPGTWQRVGAQPYQFFVDDYGAKGDGKVLLGGGGTSGNATWTDSTNSPFVSGDTGKAVLANQGASGANTQAPFTGTLTYSSSTAVTFSSNLAATTSNAPYVYGTDDAAAIKNCVNAAAAYGTTTPGNPAVDIIFGSKNYMLAALTQTQNGVGGAVLTYNTHIPVPVALQTAQKLVINFKGAGGASTAPSSEYWESTIPSLQGTSLISAITPPSQPDGTYGQMSIIGGPVNGDSTHYSLGGFANVQINIMGLTVVAPWRSQIAGVNALRCTQLNVPDARALAFVPVNLSGAAVGGPYFNSMITTDLPANDVAVGFMFPAKQNNATNFAGRLVSEGFSVGLSCAEHLAAQYLLLLYCDQGLQLDLGGVTGATHGWTILHACIEVANHGFSVINSSSGVSWPVFIGLMDMENIFTDHVNDPDSSLNGVIYYECTTSGHAVTSGAEQVTIIDIGKHSPGIWSGAPAAPASATAQQNLSYRQATVYASASTSITNTHAGVDSGSLTALGQTAGANAAIPIRVAPGGWYSVTYTGTLTTTWWLD